MPEEIINVQLTTAEVEILIELLHARSQELLEDSTMTGVIETADLSEQMTELADDLREQAFRGDWRNDAVPDAAMQMVQAGIDAREQVKELSKGRSQQQAVDVWQAVADAEVNAENEKMVKLMQGTASPCDADFMNDPLNW